MVMLSFSGCKEGGEAPLKVNLKQVDPTGKVSSASLAKPLRIGMGAMLTPKEGYIYYQRLQAYLAKKLNRPVQLVDRANYDEINELLGSKGIDAAFVCAGPYVEGKRKIGMELLAMPVVKGKPVYHAYIIVHRDSPVRQLTDLRGKVFAFTDPKSNTGKLVPTYMLSRIGETPETFFGRYIFTYGHDNSIKAVAEKHVDGAAVDSLIWEYTALKTPSLTEQTRVITKSEPYGIPPVVVRNDMDPALKKKLKEVFLQIHTEPEGKEILAGMMIDRFIPGDDANYNTIRAMNSWIAGTQKKVK
jgi:phosphonate transport system substrate-binding protein